MTNIISLIRNKYYADLRKSKWYRRLVLKNPRRALNIKWKAHFGHAFPWDNPQTLDEKIGWLQVNTDTSLWSELADKYEVRKYVEEKAGGKYLVPIYGVWDRVEDIDFEQLPDQFVIKCTHDCGSTIVVTDKANENLEAIKEKLRQHLNNIGGYATFEPHYIHIKPRIIAEKVLGEDSTVGSLIDYKIWCFDGEPYVCLVCYDRTGHHATWETFQLTPWKARHDWLSERDQKQHFKELPTPLNLSEMIEVAKKLSTNIPQVRVDLYNINGNIYFGEMTFTASSGIQQSFSDKMLLEMGKRITLPKTAGN